ncbi:MAG TPA: hypothetical protein VM598_08440, partial [Bdellovibrionota bacterium]|nr:hypothetical protein [Bdellovibrionota bacterium]
MKALLVAILLTSQPALAAVGVAGACTESESWSLGSKVPEAMKVGFDRMLTGDLEPAEGFAYAVNHQKTATTAEARVFAEYWQSRSLLVAKLPHLAFEGFARLAGGRPTTETAPVQVAALDCLNRLHETLPALGLPIPPESLHAYLELRPSAPDRRAILEYALNWLKVTNHEGQPSQAALGILKGSGPYESLAQGLVSSKLGDHAATVHSLETFLGRAPSASQVPSQLKRHVNAARLLLARALYSLGRYDQAAERYRQISRSSNDVVAMLSELSWSYLMTGRYGDAVGAASQLNAGNLRTTFAPEAPMVAAMALNELCQFPDSLKMVKKFHADYLPSYNWLVTWSKKKDREELYPLAIAHLNGKLQPGTVPERVATEWLRSPVFLALQDEVNLIYAEKEAAAEMSEEIRDRKDRLAWTAWPVLNAAFEKSSSSRQLELVARIDRELAAISSRMLSQLKQVAENSKMIKVEIYNGASHDIIWQNAHPDYKKVAKKLAAELHDQQKQPMGRVWDWGTVNAGASKIEIWEDEVGAFKANLA